MSSGADAHRSRRSFVLISLEARRGATGFWQAADLKILALSDVVVDRLYSPAVRQIASGVELVISCGDLPSAYLEYMVSMLDVPLYYVMGNHGADGGAKPFPDGCENIDGRVVEYKGLLIAGLEGSRRYNDRPNYQYTEGEMEWKIARVTPALWLNRATAGRYLDVLVTHSPPYGIHDGQDLAHTGFRSFVNFIDRYHPHYLLHGHVHVYDPRTVTETLRGRTLVVNTYGYKILDMPDTKG
jgi:Icc-related predicted phosphoesterase